MTVSAFRSRMLRRHHRISPGTPRDIKDEIGKEIDKARDGDFGPVLQNIANRLPDSKNSNARPGNNNGNHNGSSGDGHNENNGNNGGDNGDNDNDNDGGKGKSGGSKQGSSNGNGDNTPQSSSANNGSTGSGEDGPSNSNSSGGDTKSSGSSGNSNSGGNISTTSSPTSGTNGQGSFTSATAGGDSGSSDRTSISNSSVPSSVIVSAVVAPDTPTFSSSAVFIPPSAPIASSSQIPLSQQQQNNSGAIAGGVIGAILFISLALAAYLVYKRRCKNRIPASAEFANSPSTYPFARAGFGNTIGSGEKSEAFGNHDSRGARGVDQAKFQPLSADPTGGMLSKNALQITQYHDGVFPTKPQPEVLYSTPACVTTHRNVPAPDSNPGTPTSPSRRIPFGTGTFQFPPRPVQPRPS